MWLPRSTTRADFCSIAMRSSKARELRTDHFAHRIDRGAASVGFTRPGDDGDGAGLGGALLVLPRPPRLSAAAVDVIEIGVRDVVDVTVTNAEANSAHVGPLARAHSPFIGG